MIVKECHRPFQVILMNSLIADRTLPPGLIIQWQVMQHAWPAVDVTAASDLSCQQTIITITQTSASQCLLAATRYQCVELLLCYVMLTLLSRSQINRKS